MRPVALRRPVDLGRWLYRALNAAIVAFLLLPIAIAAVFAVNPTPVIQFPPVGVSLRWFQKFLAPRDFMEALRLSLVVAAVWRRWPPRWARPPRWP